MYKEPLQINEKTMDNPMDIHEEFWKLPVREPVPSMYY